MGSPEEYKKNDDNGWDSAQNSPSGGALTFQGHLYGPVRRSATRGGQCGAVPMIAVSADGEDVQTVVR